MTAKRRGFTLIELLIVIAIISLLISMIIQNIGPIRRAVDRSKCQMKIKGLINAYISYVNRDARGVFPPLYTKPADLASNPETKAGKPNLFPQQAFYVMYEGYFNAGWGPLIWHGLIKDSNDFVCPTVLDSGFEWWHNAVISTGTDRLWTAKYANPDPHTARENLYKGLARTNQSSRASYDIRPGLYSLGIDRVQQLGMRALVADNLAVPDCVLERHATGVNVGYTDGSAVWMEDESLWNNSLTWGFAKNDSRCLNLWKMMDAGTD